MNKTLSPDENNQKAYYNKIASEYDEHYSNVYAQRYRAHIYDRILKGLNLEGQNVLDALCGGGQNTSYFLARQCRVSGLDISEAQCKIYAARFPQNRIVCESILDTHFQDGEFDLVVAESLHHTPPNLDAAVAEIIRILKPNGYLLLWEPNAYSFVDKLRKLWYKLDPRYFESNERSIAINHLVRSTNGSLKPLRVIYGGHVAYLLVFTSMVLRIPLRLLSLYAPWLMKFEFGLDSLGLRPGKYGSSWVLALLQKAN